MAEKGHQVAGSDRLFDREPRHPLRKRLTTNNIIVVPQDGSGIRLSPDIAVCSTAVERGNPDVIAAKAAGVPLLTRPEYLAGIVSTYRTIAVGGTSGKSTTAGMLAFLMQRLGLSPNYIGGGCVRQFRTEKNAGNYAAGDSDYLVIEACESDGTIVNYLPAYAIILNLDLDHHSIGETAGLFERFADNASGPTFLNADDGNLHACRISAPVKFSIDRTSDYQAVNVRHLPLKTFFEMYGQEFELCLPGRHNLYNALACISVLAEMGIPLSAVAAVLPEFSGIERRFDIHLNDGMNLVIDDYAHNPHKIRSLMKTMQGISKHVCYIFQPHGFGPTRMMRDEYIRTFVDGMGEGDRLLILPIYFAGGTAAQDISSEDIAGPVRTAGKKAAAVQNRKDLLHLIQGYRSVVVFGARDDSLSGLAAEIAAGIRRTNSASSVR